MRNQVQAGFPSGWSPKQDDPEDLRVSCMNRSCEFGRGPPLPIIAVDEPIYRRLPCFIIATVDKFAALPWTGPVGGFFGRVERYDKRGFYGPCDSPQGTKLPGGRLLPPDLIIQDELHLISGPLGTMAGLYETALEELCVIDREGHTHQAEDRGVNRDGAAGRDSDPGAVQPPHGGHFPAARPGPARFVLRVHAPVDESNARLYVGVAAQGRSPKVAMLRVYLALLGAAQKWHSRLKKKGEPFNPADPYMTLLGYFNSLRELGGARRFIEDEIRNRLAGYSQPEAGRRSRGPV